MSRFEEPHLQSLRVFEKPAGWIVAEVIVFGTGAIASLPLEKTKQPRRRRQGDQAGRIIPHGFKEGH